MATHFKNIDDDTLALIAFALAIPAIPIDIWGAHQAYTIVLVPLGAPALSVWYVLALRIAYRAVLPRHAWKDTNSARDQHIWNATRYGAEIVFTPIVVWWLLPWLVAGGAP